jgi:hypothetical protein
MVCRVVTTHSGLRKRLFDVIVDSLEKDIGVRAAVLRSVIWGGLQVGSPARHHRCHGYLSPARGVVTVEWPGSGPAYRMRREPAVIERVRTAIGTWGKEAGLIE